MASKKHLGLNIPDEASERLDALAAKLNMPLTDLVRNALVEYAQKHGEPLTLDDLRIGQWGGRRVVPPLEQEEG